MVCQIGKRVNTKSGNNKNNNVKVELPTKLSEDELVFILPSYHLEQSIFGQKLSVSVNDVIETSCQPPLYTECSDTTSFQSDFNDLILDTPTLGRDSIIYSLTKLPYTNPPNLKFEIVLNKSSQRSLYTNGEIIQGFLRLQNFTNTHIPFESLIVSLDGRVSIKKTEVGDGTDYKRRNFLTLVDFTSSFTEADFLLNGVQNEQEPIKRSLPLNKRIPPLSTFERPFLFKIPEVVIDHHESASDSLSEDFSLPPSIGFLHFLHPIDPNREQELENYQNYKLQNDLTNDSFSISYSINARLVTRDVVLNKLNISCHSELFFKFIPTTPRISYGLNPTQQLKYTIRNIERELLSSSKKTFTATTVTSLTNIDEEKSQNIYQHIPLSTNLTDISKISYESCPVYENHAIISIKQPSLTSIKPSRSKFKSSCHCQSEGFFKISSPNLQDSFQLKMDRAGTGVSSNEITLNLTLTFEQPQHDHHVSPLDPSTFLPFVAPMMTFSIGINKMGPHTIPLSIDFDGSWILNKKSFELNLKRPINKINDLKNSLPAKTHVTTRLYKDMSSLFSLKAPIRHVFQDALTSTITTETNWESKCCEQLIYTKDVSITLQISPQFTKKYLLVPTFHTSQFARFYSINVGLNLSPKLSKYFSIKYQDFETNLSLNVPVDICFTK